MEVLHIFLSPVPKQKGLGVNQVPITTKQAVLIMAQTEVTQSN